MSQETLVKEELTGSAIRDGKALVEKLDEAGWPVEAAFWFYISEEARWQLYIVSETVAEQGARQAYMLIDQLLKKGEAGSIVLEDVSAIAPNHDLMRLLSQAVTTGGSLNEIRFKRNVIGTRFIEDALIYRMP